MGPLFREVLIAGAELTGLGGTALAGDIFGINRFSGGIHRHHNAGLTGAGYLADDLGQTLLQLPGVFCQRGAGSIGDCDRLRLFIPYI